MGDGRIKEEEADSLYPNLSKEGIELLFVPPLVRMHAGRVLHLIIVP